MPETINADSVLAIAVRLEGQGAAYYRRAAELVAASGPREMLLSLARMEDDHRTQFQTMQSTMAAQPAPATAPTEVEGYLQAFADDLPFRRDPTADLDASIPLDQILRLAISAERDSIALYVGLREMIADPASQDVVMKIIREEMGHATLLSNQLVELMRGKN